MEFVELQILCANTKIEVNKRNKYKFNNIKILNMAKVGQAELLKRFKKVEFKSLHLLTSA